MKIAIVGCGWVADYYMSTLAFHPSLTVTAALDIVPAHAERFRAHWNIPVFTSAEAMLAGAEFEMVLNLTNPHAHVEVSRTFMAAGKHVYSEKPLATSFEESAALMSYADACGVVLSSAPCNHLCESAQAAKRALDAGQIGNPRVIYAEMDANFVALVPYTKWRSVSGAPWPYEDEFAVGCTLEHAGYSLSWMLQMFGPVARVVSFASLQHPGKPTGGAPEAPDFSVTCLQFESGVAARLTCSVLAPRDHRFMVVGDAGVMEIRDIWRYDCPVSVKPYFTIRRRFMVSPLAKTAPMSATGPKARRRGSASMDFARGPAEMAAAIKAGRRSSIPSDFVLHLNEVALAIGGPADYRTTTRFEPLAPVEAPIL
jgi:predicted dehydrogenase